MRRRLEGDFAISVCAYIVFEHELYRAPVVKSGAVVGIIAERRVLLVDLDPGVVCQVVAGHLFDLVEWAEDRDGLVVRFHYSSVPATAHVAFEGVAGRGHVEIGQGLLRAPRAHEGFVSRRVKPTRERVGVLDPNTVPVDGVRLPLVAILASPRVVRIFIEPERSSRHCVVYLCAGVPAGFAEPVGFL